MDSRTWRVFTGPMVMGFLALSSFAQTFEHDGLNRLTNTTYNNGSTITSDYDAAGNITRVMRMTGGEVSIRSTGVGKLGDKLGGGQSDPNWSIIRGPDILSPVPAVVLYPTGGYGYVQSDTANWVWVNSSGNAGLAPYTFEVRFNVPATWVGRATLSGWWAVDNIGSIYLNDEKAVGSGVDLPEVIADNYTVLHDFSINRGLVAGENRLQIVATDTGNPGGLLVDALKVQYSGVLPERGRTK